MALSSPVRRARAIATGAAAPAEAAALCEHVRGGRTTPLHLAASGSCRLDHQLAAVERLLLAGADATLADERGLTPALVAKAHGRDEVFEVLKAAAPAAARGWEDHSGAGGKKKGRRRRGGPP